MKKTRAVLERLTGIDLDLLGGSLTLTPKRNRQKAWFSYRSQLRTLLQELQIDLVIDAGANEGQFGTDLRGIYEGELISFEPVSSVFGVLQARTDERWRAVNLALGSEPAERTINVSTATVFSSLLPTNEFGAERFSDQARELRKETIRIVRLDDYLREHVKDYDRRRIFLKMDTQGFDSNVFAGAAGALSSVHLLQSELSLIPIYQGMPHWTEAVELYERAGFRIAGMFPVSRERGAVIEYDCLMMRIPQRAP